jgi:hypothetical protein
MNQSITTEETIATLNQMLKADPKAISDLFLNRVPCNEKLVNDPYCEIGVLGIINRIFNIGQFAMSVNHNGNLIEYFTLLEK